MSPPVQDEISFGQKWVFLLGLLAERGLGFFLSQNSVLNIRFFGSAIGSSGVLLVLWERYHPGSLGMLLAHREHPLGTTLARLSLVVAPWMERCHPGSSVAPLVFRERCWQLSRRTCNSEVEWSPRAL